MEGVAGTPFVVLTAVKAVLFFTLLMLLIPFTILVERKVAGFIQDRSGPNRVGPWGLLQTIADGIKFFLKEETQPAEANRVFYLLAPAMAMLPATVLFAVVPFAAPLPTGWGVMEVVVADVSVGFLYILAIASLGVYGVVMAGWSSGSKYSFLGGLRGSAQMVSYEVALALSVVPVVLLTGDVRIPEMIAEQQAFGAGSPTLSTWLVFPLALGAFFFAISALAETNRLPFDLPEAEAELIAGYHTEYSAMKFGMFFLGEYAHLITTATLVTVFFLGGWDIPFWRGDNIRFLAAEGRWVGDPAWWKTLLTLGAFSVKTGLVVLLFMWIRWTLPRFRYDQLMDLGWKFLLEGVTVYILVIAGAVLALDAAGLAPGPAYAAILFGLNLLLGGLLFFVLDRGFQFRGAAVRSRADARRRSEEGRRAARGPSEEVA